MLMGRWRLGVVVLAVAALAPATRAEPPPPAPAEPSTWDDWSFIPILFYTPETSLGFGAAVVHSFDPTHGRAPLSTLAGGVIVTAAEQLIARIEPDLRFERVIFHGIVRAQRYPTRFFAAGAHPDDPGEPYDEATLLGSLDTRYLLSPAFGLGARCDFQWNELLHLRHGGLLDSSPVLGKDPWFAAGCGPVLAIDTRDDVRLPTRGTYAEVRALAWTSLTGEAFDALQSDLDVRTFAPLGRGHVLAAQLRLRITAGEVPFQLLPRLGGSNLLRGWFEGHLRDHNAVLAQLEWRFPIVWKVGAAVFASLGEAFHRFDTFTPSDLRLGVGAGLRLLVNKKQSVSVRFDLAYGSDISAYVDVLEAF
ncbi:MAG: BamA/TamA family outer membrane protein [Myxococcota bacterium]